MKKRFKGRKKSHQRRNIMIIMAVVTVSFAFFLSYFSSLFSKKEILEFMLKTNLFSNQNTTKKETDIFDFLLDYTIGRQPIEEVYIGTDSLQEYTPDPMPSENKKDPLIYIYNTHQGEEYSANNLGEHDIVPTVMLASYRLREELNKRNLNTIVETNQISEVLRTNNWNYAASYQASKLLMKDARNKNPSLKYYFDLHRDSIPYDTSITTHQNKTYAKVLFVIGTDHDNYKENLAFAHKINNALNNKVPNISRGILKKGGKGVNGIYNQDFSNQTLLFELGGSYNTINEVTNTIAILADSIKEVIS